ncbi:MAG: hypothetical protein NC421_10055 [Lachnospiraceae bacterium]|nr:hypothetical protein [Lachnospiraceae bacterium]
MLCFIFNGLISQAAGALATGIVIAVLLVGLLFFVINIVAERGRFSIAGYAVGVALLLFLGYHVIPACGAVALRWKCDDIEQWLNQNVISRMDVNNLAELTPDESREVVDALVENVPLVGNYVNDLQLAGMSASVVTSTVAGEIRSTLDSFVWKSVLWSLAGLLVASVIIYKTMEFRASGSRQRAAVPGADNRRSPVSANRRRAVSGGGGSLRRR